MSQNKCPECGVNWTRHRTPLDPHPSKWQADTFTEVINREVKRGRREFAHHEFAPLLLDELVRHGLRTKVLRQLLGGVWSRAGAPLEALPRSTWRGMFERVGYTFGLAENPWETFDAVERDSQPRLLYRAAEFALRRGMSWTPSRELAEEYARRNRGTYPGNRSAVWWAIVEPERLLCHIVDGIEYVVDTTGLRIRRLDTHEPPNLAPRFIDLALPLPWENQRKLYLDSTWECCGSWHWGDRGAAGVLIGRRKHGRVTRVLLHRRGEGTLHAGKWGIPGGALEADEDDRTAALREAVEETGIDVAALDIVGEYRDDTHGPDWHYTTVLALSDRKLDVNADSPETEEVRWVKLDDVESLDLHPGFAKTWPTLRKRLTKAR